MSDRLHATTVSTTNEAANAGSTIDSDAIVRSLEIAATQDSDFYDAVFDRYFELCPDSKDLMSHTDSHIRRRMMEQVVSLLMDPDLDSLDAYFAFEAANHSSYGALPHMYQNLFDACVEVVAAATGADWSDQMAQSWAVQINRLVSAMKKHSPTHVHSPSTA